MSRRARTGTTRPDCKGEPGYRTNVDTNDRHRGTDHRRSFYLSTDKVDPNDHDRQLKRRRTDDPSDRKYEVSQEITRVGEQISGEQPHPTIASSMPLDPEVGNADGSGVLEKSTELTESDEIARRRAARAEILARYNRGSPAGRSPLPTRVLDQDISELSNGASPNRQSTPTADAASEAPFDLSQSEPGNRNTVVKDDGPSAADYNPDEDRLQELRTHRVHDVDTTQVSEDASRPSKNLEKDMFDDPDDMFADPVEEKPLTGQNVTSTGTVLARPLDETVLDNWADTEGYYRVMIGELLDERYAVQSILGKGVFSAVVRAIDQHQGDGVAIKIIRSNDLMRKAAVKEIGILETLMAADPEDRKHVVRLKRTFEHRGHLCLVFESLSLNLREVLKKFGRDVGINLKAVRAYAQQMFLGLSLMRKCNIMHADLKPDNILVSEGRTLLKICDLGSASDVSENSLTPYLASRFYRAPEVILGLPYDAAMDVWAIGCTLYEMYTGKILFPGRSNNQMLRLFMECRGKFPQKLLRKAAFTGAHFDDELNFNSIEVDKITGEEMVRVINIAKPVKDFKDRLLPGTGPHERAMVLQFIDLMERCTEFDSARRITPNEALKHQFLAAKK